MATSSLPEAGTVERRSERWHSAGFTLLEMMIVVTVIGILATLAVPNYTATVVKAREAALKQGLFVIRDVRPVPRGPGKVPSDADRPQRSRLSAFLADRSVYPIDVHVAGDC